MSSAWCVMVVYVPHLLTQTHTGHFDFDSSRSVKTRCAET